MYLYTDVISGCVTWMYIE